jgi:hypothetical protein
MNRKTDIGAAILLTTPGFRSFAQAMKQRWDAKRAVIEVAKRYSATLAAARHAMQYV